jgi:hypothetical protein
MVLVVAPVASSLHGAQLRELLLPIPEHMRFNAAQVAHLTDGEIALGRNVGKRRLHWEISIAKRRVEITPIRKKS